MGKKNFKEIYLKACDELQPDRPSIKISSFCDDYDPNKNYAGIILYNHRGAFKWKHRRGSVASGYNCRFLYTYIRCTDNWSGEDFRDAGEGKVHHKMFKEMYAAGFQTSRSCCGGFAVLQGKRKYSSLWLNHQTSKNTKLQWHSDGSKMLSKGEKLLVDIAINTWKKEGNGEVAFIPSSVQDKILKGP